VTITFGRGGIGDLKGNEPKGKKNGRGTHYWETLKGQKEIWGQWNQKSNTQVHLMRSCLLPGTECPKESQKIVQKGDRGHYPKSSSVVSKKGRPVGTWRLTSGKKIGEKPRKKVVDEGKLGKGCGASVPCGARWELESCLLLGARTGDQAACPFNWWGEGGGFGS